jgi:hypothetical protein
MSRFARWILPLLLVASAFALQRESPTLERARQRWEALSREDQVRFRDRYERYRSLSEEERVMLKARAERMSEAKERFRAEMSDEVRAKLEKLEPEKRNQVVNELVENMVRERGARIREKMPEAWVERLERARPEDRVRFLADMQQRAREKATREAIEKIGQKLGLPAAEVERLKNLPGPERAATVLVLGKNLSVRDVAEFGLPPGLTEEQWNEWRALPPKEFLERVQRHRREHGWRGGPDREDGERGDPAKGPAPVPHLLLEALRSTPEEVVKYGDLPAAERRLRLFEHRRERVVALLREHKTVGEERLAEIATMSEAELYKALRQAFPNMRDGRGGHRGGPGSAPHDRDRAPPSPDGRQEPAPDGHHEPPPREPRHDA